MKPPLGQILHYKSATCKRWYAAIVVNVGVTESYFQLRVLFDDFERNIFCQYEHDNDWRWPPKEEPDAPIINVQELSDLLDAREQQLQVCRDACESLAARNIALQAQVEDQAKQIDSLTLHLERHV